MNHTLLVIQVKEKEKYNIIAAKIELALSLLCFVSMSPLDGSDSTFNYELIYFIFGCTGSSLLHTGLLKLQQARATL